MFSKVMPAVIHPPALMLEEVKKRLCDVFTELSACPLSTGVNCLVRAWLYMKGWLAINSRWVVTFFVD